ncbi:MAG: DUF4911 domain-containing protein [Proteobacteria bacterium]|nr:DUF4911 domain-containing protein [Pseudomonadota bacterium]
MTILVTMDKRDIMFFCALIEATERFCFIRTIDKNKPLIEISASPYYINELKELLDYIKKTINFEILEVLEDD